MPSNAAAAARARAKGISFPAPDVATAVAEIRAKLGPEAVILNIRQLPARGFSRLWQKPSVEITACLPNDDAPPPAPPLEESPVLPESDPPPAPRSPLPQHHVLQRYARTATTPTLQTPASPWGDTAVAEPPPASPDSRESTDSPTPATGWRTAPVLERLGLTPLHVERVLEAMQEMHGPDRTPPESMARELSLARAALKRFWRPASDDLERAAAPLHVVIGPPGSGKSTVLCKLLAKNVLVDGRSARVWRLDGRTANTSENVSLFGEILGVPVARRWDERGDPFVPGFVDLPGTDLHDADALQLLEDTLLRFPEARVHLVLNAAYSTPLLLAQARACSRLPVADVIATHLDEETAWSKLWNLVLGTEFPLSFLSTGQNIPGGLRVARPELLGSSLFAA